MGVPLVLAVPPEAGAVRAADVPDVVGGGAVTFWVGLAEAATIVTFGVGVGVAVAPVLIVVVGLSVRNTSSGVLVAVPIAGVSVAGGVGVLVEAATVALRAAVLLASAVLVGRDVADGRSGVRVGVDRGVRVAVGTSVRVEVAVPAA